ncbi:glycosyltransferase family 4 protein [Belnapia rosea]|uniref:Glycosyltransferase involved in cell wall bisynthesis n=1 Tax=Belnapia rosea TaxID=938405 RepID=A0A1G6XFR0_9PROT|nr:glycosyltransferase family 4 protein [Belnapia rosea]SDD77049.1 Glycosyltransferase involved in cell wall bisynthesis [Belnapia rosea]
MILMLSAAHPPDDIRVVRKEGAALAAAGWTVRHLAPGPADAPRQVAGVAIETYRRGPGWRGRLRNLPRLAYQAAESGAAILHASEPDAWLAALWAARHSGARVVLDVHEHYPSRLDARLPRPLRPLARGLLRLGCRLAARAADAVVVAKDGLAGDFPAARTIAVRNYALPVTLAPREHRPGPPTLVHAGAMTRSRGWPQLLAALALLPPDTRLRLIGRFTDGSEDEFSAKAMRLGLAPRIDSLGWHPHAEALRLMAEADIALVLFQPGERNHQLALPHKLFDAMLAGLPVIAPAFATEVAGIIREAGCGLLVETADPAAIAAAVATLGDPALRARLGAAGLAAARVRYGWEGEAARLVALYRDLAPPSVDSQAALAVL